MFFIEQFLEFLERDVESENPVVAVNLEQDSIDQLHCLEVSEVALDEDTRVDFVRERDLLEVFP